MTSRSWRSARRYFDRCTTNVPTLCNLLVELDQNFAIETPSAIEIARPAPADERTLAWIDDVFGGSWSVEAYAGLNLIARHGAEPVGFATIEPRDLTYAWLEGLAREPGVGIFGPFGVAPAQRSTALGISLLRLALNALRERGYARALIAAVGDERLIQYYTETVGARVCERFDGAALYRRARRVLVMASGNGSNFQAVLDASRSGRLPIEVVALLSNNPRAYVVERARGVGMSSIHITAWNRAEETREAYDVRLLEEARSVQSDLVLLLGWMHLLSDSFLRAFPQMLNLHPAFLPLDPQRDDVVMPDGTQMRAYRGPHAVRDALAASSMWVGATIHRVTSATDRGPVLARRPLQVEPGEDEAHLMERVHDLERGVVRAGLTRWLYER